MSVKLSILDMDLIICCADYRKEISVEQITQLLTKGANPNAVVSLKFNDCEGGRTMKFTAFSRLLLNYRATDLAIETLLKAGADPNFESDFENFIYHHGRRRPDALKMLLGYGADPNKNILGCTPFFLLIQEAGPACMNGALERSEEMKLYNLFLRYGGNPDLVNDEGVSVRDAHEKNVAYFDDIE